MKVLLRRAITGVVYVALLLAVVFLNSDAFDFLFMGFGLACLYELNRMFKIKDYPIYLAYMLLWWLYFYFFDNQFALLPLLVVTLGINSVLLYRLLFHKSFLFEKSTRFIISLFYIGGGFIFLTKAPYQTEGFIELIIAGFFIIIWVNDSFALLVGKYFGKHPLFKSVSPKKTIEGAVGGGLFALLAAYGVAHASNYSSYDIYFSVHQWLGLGLVIVIFGNLGDLIESKFKRTAHVKDSGAILPGHGGMLDRLDSLIFAAPFVYLFISLCNYVS